MPVSAARPGARKETLDAYIKRLEKLEEIANSYKGVERTYAIQAGREVRVMVQPELVDEAQTTVLAHDIAKRIEDEMQYPGQVKVVVIRESRSYRYRKITKGVNYGRRQPCLVYRRRLRRRPPSSRNRSRRWLRSFTQLGSGASTSGAGHPIF